MTFALGHGGHGGRMPAVLIEPFLERAPFFEHPTMWFRVGRTASCLNLRESWSLTAPVKSCLGDGTPLALDPDGAVLWEQAPPGTQQYSTAYDDSHAWVMVRTLAGARGWVSADYLDWAP